MQDKHRKSYRLSHYNYASINPYFVTICAHNRACIFSTVDPQGQIELSEIGRIIDEEWKRTEELRETLVVDDFVIMPNHVHGILIFTDGESEFIGRKFGGGEPNTLSTIVGQIKGAVTKRVRSFPGNEGLTLWQSKFWDRVIRNDDELRAYRQYIHDNPLKWAEDEENPFRKKRLIRTA